MDGIMFSCQSVDVGTAVTQRAVKRELRKSTLPPSTHVEVTPQECFGTQETKQARAFSPYPLRPNEETTSKQAHQKSCPNPPTNQPTDQTNPPTHMTRKKKRASRTMLKLSPVRGGQQSRQ